MPDASGACAHLETIRQTTHALSTVLLESEVIQVLLDRLIEALSTTRALLVLLNPEGNGFIVGGQSGSATPTCRRCRWTCGKAGSISVSWPARRSCSTI